MACRSVNNLRLSKDDMRRVYRDQARNRRGGVKIGHIIEILDILVPVIPHFFGSAHANADGYTRSGLMSYAGGEDNMSYHSTGRCGFARPSDDAMDSGRYGHSHSHSHSHGMASDDVIGGSGQYGHTHGMSYGNVGGNAHYRMGHADDYADRVISEEEFERLLEYAEQRSGKMY